MHTSSGSSSFFPELVILGEFDEQLGPVVRDLFPSDWVSTYTERLFGIYEQHAQVNTSSDIYNFKAENTKNMCAKYLLKDAMLEHLVSKALCGDFIYNSSDGPTAKKMSLRMDGVRWFEPPSECFESGYNFVACPSEAQSSGISRVSHHDTMLPLSDYASSYFFNAAPPASRENMLHSFLALLDQYIHDVTLWQNPYFKQHSVVTHSPATELEKAMAAMRQILPTTVSIAGVLFSVPDTYARGYSRVGCLIHVCAESERRRHSRAVINIPKTLSMAPDTCDSHAPRTMPRLVEILKLLNSVVDALLSRTDVLHRLEVVEVYHHAQQYEQETSRRMSELRIQMENINANHTKGTDSSLVSSDSGVDDDPQTVAAVRSAEKDKVEEKLERSTQTLEQIRDELQSMERRLKGLIHRPSPAVRCRQVNGSLAKLPPDDVVPANNTSQGGDDGRWSYGSRIDWDSFEEELGRVCIESQAEVVDNKTVDVEWLMSRGFQPLRHLSALAGALMWRFITTQLHHLVHNQERGRARAVAKVNQTRSSSGRTAVDVANILAMTNYVNLARLAYAALCGTRLCIIVSKSAHPKTVDATRSLAHAIYGIEVVDARSADCKIPSSLSLVDFIRQPVIIAGFPQEGERCAGDGHWSRTVHPPVASEGIAFVEVSGTDSLNWRFPSPFDIFEPLPVDVNDDNGMAPPLQRVTHGFRHHTNGMWSLSAVQETMSSLRQVYTAKSKLVLTLAKIHVRRTLELRDDEDYPTPEALETLAVEHLLRQQHLLTDIMKKLQFPRTKEEVNVLRRRVSIDVSSNRHEASIVLID